jgi:hypothetical protein
MKVVVENNGGKKAPVPPPLPLRDELPPEEDEQRIAKFKLRIVTTDANSATYSFVIRKLCGEEHLRYAIRFANDFNKILVGLNITTGVQALPLARELLSGVALTQFNTGFNEALHQAHLELQEQARLTASAAAGATETTISAAVARIAPPGPHIDFIKEGLNAVISYTAPHKALAKQKRWMRRSLRKPADMSIREFTNRMIHINNDEIPLLPPFQGDAQKLSDDELTDIVTSGIPKSWLREMDKQDFDPVDASLTEVLNFCERMESSEEGFELANGKPKANGNGNGNRTNKHAKGKEKSKSSGGSNGKFCLLHGKNNTHDTDGCHVMKKTAESLKDSYEKKGGTSKNKTWKRKADDSKKTTKNDLAAFVRKEARKELHAFTKKRKTTKDDDDESVKSLNMAEESADIDLSKFNFGGDSDDDNDNTTDDISV